MRQVLAVHDAAPPHWVGDGFPVRSVFSYDGLGREALSPFLMLDYAAPRHFDPAPRRRGVGVHPHRGFETVTIVYAGELEHRDSAGNGGRIGPGDVQWMTAASGILHEEFHSERFTREGGTMSMMQLWVNLPARDKMAKPRYQTILDASIPRVTLGDGAGTLRIIAGEHDGTPGPRRNIHADRGLGPAGLRRQVRDAEDPRGPHHRHRADAGPRDRQWRARGGAGADRAARPRGRGIHRWRPRESCRRWCWPASRSPSRSSDTAPS